ncbi:MAG: carboxymuconolactone decarboxylase family protein [Cyclobacteriaceae bacterium]
MYQFEIPVRSALSDANQKIYDKVKAQLGFVPNIYTYMAKHPNALADYLAFIGRKSTLTNKEKEAVSLVVSQINACHYCQSAHTALGKMNGFTEGETLELRRGEATFDPKIDALTKLAASITENRGKASKKAIENFFKAGYSEKEFIDVVFVIADKIITNFLAITTKTTIDFPLAKTIL